MQIDNKIYNNHIIAHHILIQHFRIPVVNNFKISYVDFLLLAFNVGRFKYACQEGLYPVKTIKYYEDNKLSEIQTYIDVDFYQRDFIFVVPKNELQRHKNKKAKNKSKKSKESKKSKNKLK